MWKLYDELYIGIPSGIRITGCVVGETWTIVRIDGNVGFARTITQPPNAGEYASGFVGKYLRDVACHLHWDELWDATVGVAAMNAWYNTAARAAGLDGIDNQPSKLPGNTVVVGKTGDLPMPMTPDFDPAPYEKLKTYSNVIVESMALTTRALPRLLELTGEGPHVVLTGSSLPLTALFFSFDMPVREIRGFYTRDMETVGAWSADGVETLDEGVSDFTVRPVTVSKIHESAALKKELSSVYGASKFNNRFNTIHPTA